MKRIALISSIIVGLALTAGAVAPSASAEVDTVNPWVTSGGVVRGYARVDVNWQVGPAWTFSYVQVRDSSPDGHCITPFVSVNRRALPNTGWMFLNGNSLNWWALSSYTYGTTCGHGEVFTDRYGTNVFGPRAYTGLPGAYGVWVVVCQTNRRGGITGACGGARYAANNSS